MPSACLVDDPPAYVAPKQTPPRLDYRSAEPRLDEVYVARVSDNLTFRMPVVSEDAGDTLFGIMLLDYASGIDAGIGRVRLPPSTLDDTTRVFQIDWQVSKLVAPGCHRFTLRATHELNLDVLNIPKLFDPTDSAEAYWWVNVVDPDPDNATDSNMLVDCPGASGGGL
jgi:hypothetical protein